MRRHIITLGLVASLSACVTTPTASNCSSAQSQLSSAQAALSAAEGVIPGLQAAVDTACANKTSKGCKDAETGLAIAQGLLPGLQAALAAQQASVASLCKTGLLGAVPFNLSKPGKV